MIHAKEDEEEVMTIEIDTNTSHKALPVTVYNRPKIIGRSKQLVKRAEGFLDPVDDLSEPVARVAISSGLIHATPQAANTAINGLSGGLAVTGGVLETYLNAADTFNAIQDHYIGQRKSRIAVSMTATAVGLSIIGLGTASVVSIAVNVMGSVFFPSIMSAGMIGIFALQLGRMIYTTRQAGKAAASAQLLEDNIKAALENARNSNALLQEIASTHSKKAKTKRAILQALIEREEVEEANAKIKFKQQIYNFFGWSMPTSPRINPLKNYYFAPLYEALVKIIRCQPIPESEHKKIQDLLANAKECDHVELAMVMSAFKKNDNTFYFTDVAKENVLKAKSKTFPKALEITGQLFVLAAAVLAVLVFAHVLMTAPWIVPAISLIGGAIACFAKFSMTSSPKKSRSPSRSRSKVEAALNPEASPLLKPENAPSLVENAAPIQQSTSSKLINKHLNHRYGIRMIIDPSERALIDEIFDSNKEDLDRPLAVPKSRNHVTTNSPILFPPPLAQNIPAEQSLIPRFQGLNSEKVL